jgi:hypothetical protein
MNGAPRVRRRDVGTPSLPCLFSCPQPPYLDSARSRRSFGRPANTTAKPDDSTAPPAVATASLRSITVTDGLATGRAATDPVLTSGSRGMGFKLEGRRQSPRSRAWNSPRRWSDSPQSGASGRPRARQPDGASTRTVASGLAAAPAKIGASRTGPRFCAPTAPPAGSPDASSLCA